MTHPYLDNVKSITIQSETLLSFSIQLFNFRVSNMKNRISQGIRKMSTRPPGGDDGSDTASETVDLTDYEIDEFEEERPDMCQNRCDKHSQKFVKELVESRLFNIIMTVTILINTLFLIFEVLLPTRLDYESIQAN